ncbi:hypothetical protein [Methanolapillus ohkumae]|uniref:Uncharacterized protein n=1 Tax=Methanolapillus ohkumae TaxID=3028298 RepID=A0AA96ZW64_9EURY|nr:hypothetical protein MsAm2_14530 [Methanosarcinaceae archaeon Am2]
MKLNPKYIFLFVLLAIIILAGLLFLQIHGWTAIEKEWPCSLNDTGKMMFYTWGKGQNRFESMSGNEHNLEVYGCFPSFPPVYVEVSAPSSYDGTFISIVLEDVQNWWNSIQKIDQSLKGDQHFNTYLIKNKGSLFSHNVNYYGFVTIILDSQTSKDDMENIYQIVDAYAKKEGVEEIPVIFITETPSSLITDEKVCFIVSVEKHYTLSSYLKSKINH